MDISDTLIPNSDQLDAEDLAASGPRIFTIERVSKGNAEQPVQVYFAEFDKPWRPGRNMRRVLAHCLGKDSAKWIGVKVELYCDPDVHFGKEKVGGTRISRLSHINGPIDAPIIIGRGKRGKWKVQPIADAAPTAPQPSPDDLAAQIVANLADCTTEAEVREWGNRAHARNLLDVQVDGKTVKVHVEERLAVLADVQAGADA